MNSRKSIINQSYFAIGVVAFLGIGILSNLENETVTSVHELELTASNSFQPTQGIEVEIKTLSESEVRSLVGQ